MSLAGCARFFPPPQPYYVAPRLAPGLAAIIAVVDGPTYVTARLTRIDGKSVNLVGSMSQTLAPGAHIIDAYISLVSPPGQGWLTTSPGPQFGSDFSFRLTVEPGKNYVLRVREPVEVALYCQQTAAWVESDDGTFVSADMPVMLARVFHDEEGTVWVGKVPIFVNVPAHQTHC